MDNPSQGVRGRWSPARELVEIPRSNGVVDFERLYKLYSRRVYALCFRVSRSTEEAEDLSQEAFLQVFRKIDTFRGESAFATWLYRVVLNVVLMRMRKKRPPENSLDEEIRPGHESSNGSEYFGAPDATLAGSIDRVHLERAITQLPPGYRFVFLLHDVEGYDHNEIAGILGWAQGTSKSQLHKARLRLRDLLRGVASRETRADASLPSRAAAWKRTRRRTVPAGKSLTLKADGPRGRRKDTQPPWGGRAAAVSRRLAPHFAEATPASGIGEDAQFASIDWVFHPVETHREQERVTVR